MRRLSKRVLFIPPAAAIAAALWILVEFGSLTGTMPAFPYAFVVTSIGILLVTLPASYGLKGLSRWVWIVALTFVGALCGAFILSVVVQEWGFYEPGLWCGGLGSMLWSVGVAIAEGRIAVPLRTSR